jgi:hypothetical protein
MFSPRYKIEISATGQTLMTKNEGGVSTSYIMGGGTPVPTNQHMQPLVCADALNKYFAYQNNGSQIIAGHGRHLWAPEAPLAIHSEGSASCLS